MSRSLSNKLGRVGKRLQTRVDEYQLANVNVVTTIDKHVNKELAINTDLANVFTQQTFLSCPVNLHLKWNSYFKNIDVCRRDWDVLMFAFFKFICIFKRNIFLYSRNNFSLSHKLVLLIYICFVFFFFFYQRSPSNYIASSVCKIGRVPELLTKFWRMIVY